MCSFFSFFLSPLDAALFHYVVCDLLIHRLFFPPTIYNAGELETPLELRQIVENERDIKYDSFVRCFVRVR